MPKTQSGSVVKRSRRNYGARFYDESGARCYQGGFETQSAAEAWLRVRVGEVAALRRGDPTVVRRRAMPTFDELCDEFVGQHVIEANSLRTLTARLLSARRKWGAISADRIVAAEVGLWRKTLPERSAPDCVTALRQVLNYAVRTKLLDENVANAVPNPPAKRREAQLFSSPDDVDAVAAELPAMFRAIPVFAAWTGLRPEEWIGLERRDIDRQAGLVTVRRVYTDGQVKLYGKQAGSLRTVPVPSRALEALDAAPTRIDTALVFPGRRGGHMNLHHFRNTDWTPAVKAAGLEHRPPYALRHSYASWAIAAGIGLFELSRLMGTSVEQIDVTYGHLLPDSLDRARAALESFGHCVGTDTVVEAQESLV